MSQHLEGELQKLRCKTILFFGEMHLLMLETLLSGLGMDFLSFHNEIFNVFLLFSLKFGSILKGYRSGG